jgi:hypothetical protein
VRVYLAATYPILRVLASEGHVDGPLDGFTASAELRRELGDVADEELEYALTLAAAEASAALIGVDGASRGRRFVLVADVDDVLATADRATPGAVLLDGGVSLSEIEAILADDHDIAVHEGISDELGWFATQEIGDLLA